MPALIPLGVRPRPALSLRRLLRCLAPITLLAAAACSQGLQLINTPSASATTTTGPWSSMIYAARTDSGILVIDLGWTGAERGLKRVLKRLDATPADVRWAFITHAHRDHIGGWKHVMQATFVVGKDEVPLFVGNAEYRGWLTRLADRIDWYPRPIPSQITLRAVGNDTAFVLGSDTLRAYPVPGHTPGSMAYLFRGVLFVGDAVFKGKIRDFQGARREFSDSTQQSKASMTSLIARLDSTGVVWNVLCTAHAKCAVADSALRRKIQR